jgi:EAL domain-containing protein (putative c-di-GMP-specific phosphodiesterase class I)
MLNKLVASQPVSLNFSLADIQNAIQAQQFELYYQPYCDCQTGLILGVEALIRWHHPSQGLILPDRFIPQIEAAGWLVELGDWILETACTQAMQWHQAGFPSLTLSVNIAADQLQHPEFVTTVQDLLHRLDLAPSTLVLELTESTRVLQVDRVVSVLSQLRAQGVQVALDDFGTGYASLAYLKAFPCDWLKLDRSFVQSVDDNATNAVITAVSIQLAHQLGLQIVAEGVEQFGELEFLRQQGCDVFQGHWFSFALPADRISQLLCAQENFSPEMLGLEAISLEADALDLCSWDGCAVDACAVDAYSLESMYPGPSASGTSISGGQRGHGLRRHSPRHRQQIGLQVGQQMGQQFVQQLGQQLGQQLEGTPSDRHLPSGRLSVAPDSEHTQPERQSAPKSRSTRRSAR